MAKLKIDEADLLMALESHDGSAWYLDRQTGEVIWATDGFMEEEELMERIDEDDGERYLAIEPRPSHEGFRMMEDFIDSLPDGEARGALFQAIERTRPFRSFKDELHRFPEIQEQWYRYEEERMREYALDWLRAEGVEAELVDRYAAGSG